MNATALDARRRLSPLAVLTVALLLAAPCPGAEGNVDLPRYPSISPDGGQIVFTWRGDLWKVPSTGGTALRLTSHPGDDVRSTWSADGERIAFTSNRSGHWSIHLMSADGTGIRRLTEIDRDCVLGGFGVDGDGNEIVTLHGVLEGDVFREHRPYMVSTAGGDLRRMHDAFGSQPRVSRDGSRVAFVRGNYYDRFESRRHYRGADASDIWIFDRGRGAFTRLTAWEGNDRRPIWGGPRTLLYLSDRELDCVNLYRMSAEEGQRTSVRLTAFDEDDVQEFDVSADGSTIVLAVWDTLYTFDPNDPGAAPIPLRIRASEDERDGFTLKSIGGQVTEAALSPDGEALAVIAYGEVYVRNVEEGSPTRRVTDSPAREQDLAWSPDGLRLFFVSDRDGTESIYAATVARTRGEVRESFEETTGVKLSTFETGEDEQNGKKNNGSKPKNGGPDDPVTGAWTGSVEIPDAGLIDFTFTFELHEDSTVTGDLASDGVSGTVTGTWDAGSRRLSLSLALDDGGAVTIEAVIEDGILTGTVTGEEMQMEITATRSGASGPGEEGDGGDGEKKDDEDDLPRELRPSRWHDALAFTVEPVVQRETNDRDPRPSPDGRRLAFRSTRGDVQLLDHETGAISTLLEGWDAATTWRWSPDGRHVAYARSDLDFNSDIFIVPVDGSRKAVNITRHPDNDENPRFSADGKVLSFCSDRVNDEYDIWMVYLDKDLEALTPQERKAYYESAKKAAKKRKPVAVRRGEEEEEEEGEGDRDGDGDGDRVGDEDQDQDPGWDLEDAYLRLRRVTRLNGNENGNEMTPGGERLIFDADGDESGLFSVEWNGSGKKRLGSGSVQHVNLGGDKVVIVSGKRAGTVGPEGGSVEFVDIADRIRIDLEAQSSQKFLEAARGLGEEYYHPTMNGTDWPALSVKYRALAERARTAEEFNWVANRLIGELNGSHLSITARDPASPNRQTYGRLGTMHRRVADGFEITGIVPLGPAEKGPMALRVGDVVTAIEFRPFGPTDTVETHLKDRIGKETVLSIRRTLDDGETADIDLFISPIGFGRERQLMYEAWRRENARLAAEWSDGRIGYIHIQGMNQPSLDVFERDLFAAAEGKDGLIIDVRNNGGGWTADRVLASIMVREHAYTIPRGADPAAIGHYPQPRLFIQRYTLPTNMLCNEKSYSNAEIVSHAFKTLKRGTLVGQQTHGSVISTGGWSLIDGTWVRLPFRGWFVKGGMDMELNGAMPDLVVPQTPESEVAGEDEQLKAAVVDLLERLNP